MNRWHIYEMLKNQAIPTKNTISEIDKMDAEEIKEGLIEWFILLNKDKHYQRQVKGGTK
jgi:hypothetical protein